MALLELAAQPGGVDRDVDDAVLLESEHDPPLQRVGRVVEVDDRPLGAGDALVGALDQLVAALDEHLDGHVVRDQVLLDQLADEVEVGLAGRREADLDLLEAHRHERHRTCGACGRGPSGRSAPGCRHAGRPSTRAAPCRSCGSATCGRGARSGRTARYFSNGIGRGVAGVGGMAECSKCENGSENEEPPGRGGRGVGERESSGARPT